MKITIIIPTINEVDGLTYLLPKLNQLPFIKEIIVVDDGSTDGTVSTAHIKGCTIIQRVNTKGLASAIREGAGRATTDFLLIMDGDGQHSPEEAEILYKLWTPVHDLVVGSRILGSYGKINLIRKLGSKTVDYLWKKLVKRNGGTWCSDPLSGFFIARRELILKTKTNGFKILAEILLQPYLIVSEAPITMKRRLGGQSKMSWRQLLYLFLPSHT